jgi:hypothetical protein
VRKAKPMAGATVGGSSKKKRKNEGKNSKITRLKGRESKKKDEVVVGHSLGLCSCFVVIALGL